ncbi:MAG: DNA-deoxyinosine glycosylase [Rhodanobacteraceae bacterium]
MSRIEMPRRKPIHSVASFPPQVATDCRVLVLGTVPSVRSLALRQSYGHPQNLFWPFMGELFDAGPAMPYAERISRLHELGIGIWDVLHHCERPGSLDSAIVRASEVPNDIVGLLAETPTIRAIAFNGAKACQSFRRHMAPRLDAGRARLLALPSTSPANASISRRDKLAAWSVLRELVRSE